MLNGIIRKNKGVVVLIVMFIIFAFVASKRVDTLEKIEYSDNFNLVYNKWKRRLWIFSIMAI